jgi:cytochrome P450
MDLAFSDPIGFCKEGKDIDNTISGLQAMFSFALLMVNLPGLVKFIQQPWLFKLIAPKTTDKKGPGFLQGLAIKAVQKRLKNGNPSNRRDILQQMLEYKDSKGNGMSIDEVEAESYAPIGAGSDTTSVAIRGAILYITSNPYVYIKLMDEISHMEETTGLSTPVSFKQCQEMPYLNAVCREVLRLNSPVGTPFPRLVPAGGVTIAGHFLPAGTEVGINSWCIARSKAIYGEDANHFRPERWLESEQQTKRYEKCDISFGAGYTVCLGKNIAVMEMMKTVVELLRGFEITVAYPEKPWVLKNMLAILIFDFYVFLRPREKRWAVEKI